MRLLIIGLGVIGTGCGWAFAEAGHDIVHLVRPGRVRRCAGDIAIDLLDRRPGFVATRNAIYRPAVVEALSADDDFGLVMVPVKHCQLVDSLRELLEHQEVLRSS